MLQKMIWALSDVLWAKLVLLKLNIISKASLYLKVGILFKVSIKFKS